MLLRHGVRALHTRPVQPRPLSFFPRSLTLGDREPILAEPASGASPSARSVGPAPVLLGCGAFPRRERPGPARKGVTRKAGRRGTLGSPLSRYLRLPLTLSTSAARRPQHRRSQCPRIDARQRPGQGKGRTKKGHDPARKARKVSAVRIPFPAGFAEGANLPARAAGG